MFPRLDRRAVLTSIVLVILVAFGATAAHGQVALGDTVRFNSGSFPTRGVLVGYDSASVTIGDGGSEISYPRSTMKGFEVLRGHHRTGLSSVGAGAAIGLLSGLALGAAGSSSSSNHEEAGLGYIFGAVLGTAAGTLVGGALAFREVDEWRSVALPVTTSAATTVIAAREVAPGDVIRFAGPIRVDEAALVAIAPRQFVVQPLDDTRALTVPAAEMVHPEVRRGYRPWGMRAVAIGALAGAGIGLIYSLRTAETGGLGTAHPIGAIPILIGATNGTVVGLAASIIPVPNWREFDAVRAATP